MNLKIIDIITMDILRGFQGVGGAAALPSAVRIRCNRLFPVVIVHIIILFCSLVSSPIRSRHPALVRWHLLRLQLVHLSERSLVRPLGVY